MTIKNHQTTIGIIEKGIQEANSTRIQLLGPQALLTEPKFNTLNLTDAQTIAQNHVIDSFIFYTVEKHTQNALVSIEKGIGKLEKEGDNYFIRRLVPISQGKNVNSLSIGKGIADFESTRDTFLTIGTSAPSNINELLFLPHSVATSNAKGVQTTPIPLNSLLGRLNGDIEAIDIEGLADLLGNVSLKRLKLAPATEPTDPTSGMIYYDITRRTLRQYNGTVWYDVVDGGNF